MNCLDALKTIRDIDGEINECLLVLTELKYRRSTPSSSFVTGTRTNFTIHFAGSHIENLTAKIDEMERYVDALTDYRSDLLKKVSAALKARLDPKNVQILKLYYIDSLGASAIAGEMNISRKTVYNRMRKIEPELLAIDIKTTVEQPTLHKEDSA